MADRLAVAAYGTDLLRFNPGFLQKIPYCLGKFNAQFAIQYPGPLNFIFSR